MSDRKARERRRRHIAESCGQNDGTKMLPAHRTLWVDVQTGRVSFARPVLSLPFALFIRICCLSRLLTAGLFRDDEGNIQGWPRNAGFVPLRWNYINPLKEA